MHIILGTIGEEHAINSLKEVITEFPEIELQIFYDEKELITYSIIEKFQTNVDAWLVFDQITYLKISKWGKSLKPLYYIPYRGASFFKTLCKIIYQGFSIDDLSIDTIPYNDILRGLTDLDIKYRSINYLTDDGSLNLSDYISYHKSLFQSGKTKAAVTKSYFVKKSLDKENIPAFCVLPMRVTIRSILNLISSDFNIKRLKESQIAVQVFNFDFLANKSSFYTVDDLYSREIALIQKLINYAKQINGSLKPASEGNFYIFTTRGMLEKVTNSFNSIPILQELEDIENNLNACGIGVGSSAREAEYNAVTALKHAHSTAKGSWFVMFDDKTMKGPLGTASSASYQFNSEKLEAISRQTSLNVTTLSKVSSALKAYGRNTISASELAMVLNILPRSARRILSCLMQHGFAEEAGSETLEVKGRPRKIYKINFKLQK